MADNNRESLFVIAIGGTGMRCLESFVHLCAIGMFDNREINIMTLDTDSNNGNKSRVQTLIKTYQDLRRTVDGNEGKPQTETFFSAKLNFFEFTTNYEGTGRTNYKSLSEQVSGISQEDKQKNQDLSDLFLDHDTVQQFSLLEGYRAQTHLGSMLMYNGIVEAAMICKNDMEKASKQQQNLSRFLDKLKEANAAGNGRVFVFGSVFGGTGASSIPIIPKALQAAVQAKSAQGESSLDFGEKLKIGAALLTQYFSFAPVDSSSLRDQKVIANSDNFAINSQAALQFYSDDKTVKTTYKRLYHIGWPFERVHYGPKTGVLYGGENQKNQCHVVELLCACAAYEFFSAERKDLNNPIAEYYFKSVKTETSNSNSAQKEYQYDFSERLFVGTGPNGDKTADIFRRKLGAFTSLSLLILAHQEAASKKIKDKELIGVTLFTRPKEGKPLFTDPDLHYDDLEKNIELLEKFDDYLRSFGYKYEGANRVDGWLFQINNSIRSVNGNFFIHPQCFNPDNLLIGGHSNVDEGEVFTNVSHNWYQETSWMGKKRKESSHKESYAILEKNLKNPACKPKSEQGCNTVLEQLVAHLYNALMMSQN